jgi:hypothetical protein
MFLMWSCFGVRLRDARRHERPSVGFDPADVDLFRMIDGLRNRPRDADGRRNWRKLR